MHSGQHFLVFLEVTVLNVAIVYRVLLSLDRFISSSTGRPCSLNDEEYVFNSFAFPKSKRFFSFDLDYPIECDDEYWDNGFQQPAGKPSSIAYFNCFLRLMDILAYAMRLIVSQASLELFKSLIHQAQYPIRRPNEIVNVPTRSDQQVIAQLDSAMNKWLDIVPSHRR